MTTTTIINQNRVQTDVLGRVRVSAETREAMMDAYEVQGGSAVRFACEHGVRPTTFASWIQKRRRARGDYEDEEIRRKLRMRKPRVDSVGLTVPEHSEEEGMKLIEVDLSELEPALPVAESHALKVTLSNGAEVELCSEAQLPLLKALMKEVSC